MAGLRVFFFLVASFASAADDLPPGGSQAQRCAAYLSAQVPTTFEEVRELRHKIALGVGRMSATERARVAELTLATIRLHQEATDRWNLHVPALHRYRIRPMSDVFLSLEQDVLFPFSTPTAGDFGPLVAEFAEGLMLEGGRPLSTEKWSQKPRSKTNDVGLFCMDGDGKFYLLPVGLVLTGENHHNSLQDGMPMAACGELTVIAGKVTYIQNRTGHYGTSVEFFDQALAELRRHGSLHDAAQVVYYAPDDDPAALR